MKNCSVCYDDLGIPEMKCKRIFKPSSLSISCCLKKDHFGPCTGFDSDGLPVWWRGSDNEPVKATDIVYMG